jgi:hypothetical protein
MSHGARPVPDALGSGGGGGGRSSGGDAEELRQRGNEFFRAGNFADAEDRYTRAIELLRATAAAAGKGAASPLLLPLHNNRAAVRLKTGQYRGAVEDCDAVQGWQPGEAKSLLKRAAAWEGLERWEEALQDHAALAAQGVAQAREGQARCRKALGTRPGASPTRPVAASAAPVAAAAATAPAFPAAMSQAVQGLRERAQAAEAEDASRFAVKDAVEGRVAAWRRGKEENVRALLASLDGAGLLWPDLGWRPIQLSELVTPPQVRTRYMRAVARLHPDKLARTCTPEQRLLAAEIFSALSRAWEAFRAANGGV